MKNSDYVDLNGRIEKYSNNVTHKGIGSSHHLPKGFVRLDDNTDERNRRLKTSAISSKKTAKDSLFFGDLFRSLMKKDNHYITYLNDSFKCPKSEMIVPDHVSCLLKNYAGILPERCYFECVGSRLANSLGVDTVYNVAIASTYDEDYDSTEYDTLISVDYVPYGYKTENMLDLGLGFDEDSKLSDIMDTIDATMPDIAKKKKLKITPERISNLKEQFALQYLFRTLICEDYDFQDKNVSILMGDNGDFRLGPAYDMEFLFDGGKAHGYYQDMANDALTYMSENMPKALDNFMKNLEKQHKSGKIENLIMNTMDISVNTKRHVKNHVDRNCKRLNDMYLEMQQESPTNL